MADVGHELEREVGRQILRYETGRAITCLVCSRVLDMRRAVLWTASSGQCVVLCALDWDDRGPQFIEHPQEQMAGGSLPATLTWQILDGRQLWGRS